MSEFQEFLNEQLQDDEFRKEWEDIQPEMDVIRAMIDARISQNLTQKELAERTGINQADISKLENGTRNPSLKLLKQAGIKSEYVIPANSEKMVKERVFTAMKQVSYGVKENIETLINTDVLRALCEARAWQHLATPQNPHFEALKHSGSP